MRYNFFYEAAKSQPGLSKLSWIREGCLDLQKFNASDKLTPFYTLNEFYTILYSVPPGEKVGILAADVAFNMNEINFSGWIYNEANSLVGIYT